MIAKIKIELTVRAENHGMNAVIALQTARGFKKDLFFIGYIVTVFIGEDKYIRTGGNNHLIAQHTYPQRSIYIFPLVEHFGLIRFPVAIRIFQDKDFIPFFLIRYM